MDNLPVNSLWRLRRLLDLEPVWGGDTWEEVIEFALADPMDFVVIERLCSDLSRNGSFREPLRIEADEDSNDYIGNGMHRIIAHVLCEVDEVLVTRDQGDLQHMWKAKFVVMPETVDPILDLSFGLSQPVGDDGWIERLGAGIMDGIAEVDICATAELEPGYVAEVVAAFYTRHGVPLTVEEIEVEPLVWDEDEDGNFTREM